VKPTLPMSSLHRSLPRTTMVSALDVDSAELRCSWRPIFMLCCDPATKEICYTFLTAGYRETPPLPMSTQTGPDQYLEVNGARLRWRLAGQGPALVLLHGWPLDLEYWNPLCTLLTDQFTVLRFDRRGFGLSTGQPDIHRNVDDLCAVMDAAAVARAVLVGMSQGARLSLHFAIRHPQRTRALVLEGAPAVEAESEVPLARCARRSCGIH
jgi:hypothetical protein